jgi:hypothetical protein
MSSLRFAGRRIALPGSVLMRRVLGGGLIAGGVLGFLPILGFWMLPLGLLVLSVDSHPIRRVRRRAEVWWGRRSQRENE